MPYEPHEAESLAGSRFLLECNKQLLRTGPPRPADQRHGNALPFTLGAVIQTEFDNTLDGAVGQKILESVLATRCMRTFNSLFSRFDRPAYGFDQFELLKRGDAL
jgi:hypothetical protein